MDRLIFYNTIAWLVLVVAGSHRASSEQYSVRTTYRFLLHVKYTLLYGMAMTVSSLVHWPLMGGLLHLAR